MLASLSKWFASPGELRRKGVLGMNERNLSCIGQYNPRRLFPLVDDKLQTKLLAEDYQLATPKLLAVLRSQIEVKNFERYLPSGKGFAIKPAKGSGGKGILVIQEARDGRYRKASGKWVSRQHLERHLSNLISGLYSLGGNPDVAIIESLIESDPTFENYTFEGVPDIRIVVYRGYPAMAMMRLSTHASDGKANLHQGAIGVGIDLATGKATNAVQFDRPVSFHPDTGQALNELEIGDWRSMLLLASRCYDMTGLGYLGADLVLDANQGALLLELNARPGLAIQLANGVGLAPRLKQLDLWSQRIKGPEQPSEDRVAAAQQLFSTELASTDICMDKVHHVE
ncbi:alpha-L-glutamate ligase-related protein [Marinospirillum celere]|uniref:Alpha-L-glutamate ligase-related protein n=1 Tax=Marinospirillum celere TaxID=1122252 RepID=A0A1I1EQP6_9GAMM|nr:alpha-L-glutamate ligase-like protein [Marinospirillum celere]SFB88982.1 alpha-L-glutamate ligase-related protein [Marinospirillum celere]